MKIRPTEFRCLIEMDEVDEKTAGGLYVPLGAKEAEEYKQEVATFISCGSRAFEEWRESDTPKPGDRIIINKYQTYTLPTVAGIGKRIRLINDKDITAILEEE